MSENPHTDSSNHKHGTISLEPLLDYLNRSRGFDFGGYKPASLARRIEKRMEMVKVENYADYVDFLEVHPDEFTHLFNTILINVTSFFRDPAVWEYLDKEIIPRIIGYKNPKDSIRIWSAGCASGEEAYSAAMLLYKHLGKEAFIDRVKIYATDVDEEALAKARQAVYAEREVADIPEKLREEYFERSGDRYTFDKDLRRAVIFGRHDLIQDAPISRVDLLICRNLLMYFNAETQNKVLARLHFALADGGYMMLGRAEMLLTHTNIFSPVDLKLRMFSRVPKIALRDRLAILAQSGNEDAMNHLLTQIRLRDAAFDITPVALVIIDIEGTLTHVNQCAQKLFGLSNRDIGKKFQDLQLSYRPVELRSAIEQAYAKHEPMMIMNVDWPTPDGLERGLDIQVQAISENGDNALGAIISFIDVTQHKQLERELGRTNQELETAMEELQSTNEELETTNEELQSTVEELETTNEELQSSNEELETMNEELHSSNEELETINDELRQRTDDLNEGNGYLESILRSMRGGVIVVSPDMAIPIWNRKAEDLWGLRPEEVRGTNFQNLDIGLPVEQLKKPLRAIIAGEADYQDTRLDATNRRGKPIKCRVTISPLFGNDRHITGAVVVTEDLDSNKDDDSIVK